VFFEGTPWLGPITNAVIAPESTFLVDRIVISCGDYLHDAGLLRIPGEWSDYGTNQL